MREHPEVGPTPVDADVPNRPDLVREAQAREAERQALSRDWHVVLRRRVAWAATFAALWAVGIEARLVYLQVVAHEDLLQRAARQWSRTREVPPNRGDLLDRKGRVLAFSVDGDAIYAEPPLVVNPEDTARRVCDALTGCGTDDRAEMLGRLTRQKSFQYLWRRASPADAARIRTLNLPGIGVLSEQRRYYPNRELAAHVLGFANLDNVGLGGIESAYNDQISGRPGRVLLQTDGKNQAHGRVERPPTAGATLELTIDRDLQYIAERELALGVAEFGAVGGTVIALDPRSGDVLALANAPTFNPNRFQDADANHRRNRALQDVYEPGSTFKVVTASAALEEGLMRPDDPIDVSAGHIRFGSRQIDDVHRYGTLSFADVIVKSSNVGAIKVGLRLGADRLTEYVQRFGFGQAIARDLPGQSRGIVWDAARLNDSALASVSMGYQVGVTPVQMVSAVSTVANGGELLEPRLVRAVIEGHRRAERQTRVLRRVITAETAAKLTGIMEQVVEAGTAKAAQVPGYTVAGKTGTAAKLERGRYSKTEYNASFVGFIPSRDPVLTILVVIDSPHGKGFYGGAVAAPIFARVARAMLRHLGVPPNVDPAARITVVRHDAPVPADVVQTAAHDVGFARLVPMVATGLVPDVRGLGAREAARLLAAVGLAPRLLGDGVVVEQELEPGSPVHDGRTCLLRLSRRPFEGAAEAGSGSVP
jgi:cell division protein FtsI (penicillin-binding protein 3)